MVDLPTHATAHNEIQPPSVVCLLLQAVAAAAAALGCVACAFRWMHFWQFLPFCETDEFEAVNRFKIDHDDEGWQRCKLVQNS